MKYVSQQMLDDAEADLCWYLQHEQFDAKKEKRLRSVCEKLRKQIKEQNERRQQN